MFFQRLAPLGAAVILMFPGAVSAQIQQVGIAAGVRGSVSLAPAGAPVGLAIKTGQPIHVGERVRSGPDGALQIILLDETVFTIGPNSDIEIEDFGFDPRSGAGKVNASIGSGSFKFVTGRVAQNKPENMTVRVPTAIMGVRGTIVFGQADARQAVIALGGPGNQREGNDRIGAVSVRTPQGAADLRRAGYAAFVQSGQPPDVRVLDAAAQQRILGALGSVQAAAVQAQQPAGGGSGGGSSGGSGSGRGKKGGAAAGGGDGGVAAIAGQAASASTADAARATIQLIANRNNNQVVVPAFVANANTLFQEINGLGGTATFALAGNALVNTGGAGGAGTYDFSLTVNFAARSFSGQFSNINIAGGAGNAITNGTLTIPVTSYAAFANAQAMNFTVANNTHFVNAACGGGNSCTGEFFLVNGAARAANTAQFSLEVANGGNTSQSAFIPVARP
jgi:hypothetical protein